MELSMTTLFGLTALTLALVAIVLLVRKKTY